MDKYRITYYPKKDDALYIRIPNKGPVKFKSTPEGLYYIDTHILNKYKKQSHETNHVISKI